MKNHHKATLTLSTCVCMVIATSQVQAILIQVGPGADLAGTSVGDTAGEDRQNVALSSPADDFVNLAAGTYSVRDFQLNVFNHATGNGDAGTVSPMLLIGSSGSWTTLWVDHDFDPTSNGEQTAASYGAGVETFTLATSIDVYAGFFTKNGGSNITAINLGVGKTDHDGNGFTAPTGSGQTVNGISNPNLGRAYAFELNVEVVPEPSTTALLGLGGLALILRRRK